ncbi:hypothetical protein AMECASPLE_027283 [Ameca splendens]|uniref:Uncharacterized protein n=1 Tax=Ameca splendens TaxID=208324 RepID=A0ABV0ZE43_9TELE
MAGITSQLLQSYTISNSHIQGSDLLHDFKLKSFHEITAEESFPESQFNSKGIWVLQTRVFVERLICSVEESSTVSSGLWTSPFNALLSIWRGNLSLRPAHRQSMALW